MFSGGEGTARVTKCRGAWLFRGMGIRIRCACPDAGRGGAALIGVATAAVAWLCLCLCAPLAHAQAGPDLAPCVPDGSVHAITHTGGNTYVGGHFDAVGQRSGSGVPLADAMASGGGSAPNCQASTDPGSLGGSPVSGQPIRPFPEVGGGSVYAAISDGNGGWYIGGTFTSVDGTARVGLAHITSAGSVAPGVGDPNAPGGGNGIACNVTTPCAVYALALDPAQPDVLYVGGSFDGLGSPGNVATNAASLVALYTDDVNGPNTAGTVVGNDWTAPSPSGGPVKALEAVPINVDVSETGNGAGVPVPVRDATPKLMSILVVGGDFTALGATTGSSAPPVKGLGAVWGAGAVQSCVPNSSGTSPSCVAGAPGANTEMGGYDVATVPGQPSSGSGAWNPAPGPVNAVAVGQPSEKDSNPPCGATPATETGVCKEFLPVYAGETTGSPLQAFQLPIIIRSSNYGSNLPGVASNPSQYSPWPSSGSPAIGSGCDGASSTPAVNALALSPQPTRNDFTSPVPSGTPTTGASLYVGGDFTIEPATANSSCVPTNLVAVHAITAPDASTPGGGTFYTGWDPNGSSGFNGAINALAASPDGSSVYVGGDFTQSSAHVGYAAAFSGASGNSNSPISAWTPLLAGGEVDALALGTYGPNSTPSVYAGGGFDSTGAVVRSDVAAFDSSGGLLSWDPGVSMACGAPSDTCAPAEVLALAASGSSVYAGGSFDTLTPAGSETGTTVDNLAAIDASTGLPASGFGEPNPDRAVLALDDTGDALYVGGSFDTIGDQSRSALAKLDPASGAVDPQWNPDAQPGTDGGTSVNAINASCNTVYAGGDFASIGAHERNDVAALDPSSGAATTWDPNANGNAALVDSYVNAIVRADGIVYLAGNFDNYVGAFSSSSGLPKSNFHSPGSYTAKALVLAGSTLYLGQTGPHVPNLIAAQGDPSATDQAGNPLWGYPLDSGNQATSGEPADGSQPPAPDHDVYALSAYGSTLYVGGNFTIFGTMPQASFAAIPLATDVGNDTTNCSVPTSAAAAAVQPSGPGAGTSIAVPKPTPAPQIKTPTPPVLTAFKQSHRRWREGVLVAHTKTQRKAEARIPLGTTFSFVLNQKARITMTFSEQLAGRSNGRRCLTPTKHNLHNRPCTRTVTIGTMSLAGKLGTNKLPFKGRLLRFKELAPGTYGVAIIAINAAGLGSSPRRLTFTIVGTQVLLIPSRRQPARGSGHRRSRG